jgi:hypothetical protein
MGVDVGERVCGRDGGMTYKSACALLGTCAHS